MPTSTFLRIGPNGGTVFNIAHIVYLDRYERPSTAKEKSPSDEPPAIEHVLLVALTTKSIELHFPTVGLRDTLFEEIMDQLQTVVLTSAEQAPRHLTVSSKSKTPSTPPPRRPRGTGWKDEVIDKRDDLT